MRSKAELPYFIEAFFTDYLIRQKHVSPNTVSSYRDTFRLLFKYAAEAKKKMPSQFLISDFEAPFILSFLDHLEAQRRASARSRNQRLAAIRSFFRFLSLNTPEHGALIQRVLSIPNKRYERALVAFLTPHEVDVLLAAPDQKKWSGQRDHALMLLAIQTGLRVSELISIRQKDVVLEKGPHIRCVGKGRKERCTPLTKQTVSVLRAWLRIQKPCPTNPLFPNRKCGPLSSDGVQYILEKHVLAASKKCLSLQNKNVSPHVLRHTTAMQLLLSGVDRTVIALWLGHESTDTTQVYFDANLAIKEEVLAKTAPINTQIGRFQPDDSLLVFLKNL
jgi:integrase/recombinase XerD